MYTVTSLQRAFSFVGPRLSWQPSAFRAQLNGDHFGLVMLCHTHACRCADLHAEAEAIEASRSPASRALSPMTQPPCAIESVRYNVSEAAQTFRKQLSIHVWLEARIAQVIFAVTENCPENLRLCSWQLPLRPAVSVFLFTT